MVVREHAHALGDDDPDGRVTMTRGGDDDDMS